MVYNTVGEPDWVGKAPGCRLGAIKIKAGLEQQEKNNTVAAAFHKWYKKVPQVAQKIHTQKKLHKPAQKRLLTIKAKCHQISNGRSS